MITSNFYYLLYDLRDYCHESNTKEAMAKRMPVIVMNVAGSLNTKSPVATVVRTPVSVQITPVVDKSFL